MNLNEILDAFKDKSAKELRGYLRGYVDAALEFQAANQKENEEEDPHDQDIHSK